MYKSMDRKKSLMAHLWQQRKILWLETELCVCEALKRILRDPEPLTRGASFLTEQIA